MFKVALFLLSRLHTVQEATPFFQVYAHWHKQYGEGHAPFVGIILDSVAMESRLPVNKLKKKKKSGMLKQFLHKIHVSNRTFQFVRPPGICI